jgi:hypothetical protein
MSRFEGCAGGKETWVAIVTLIIDALDTHTPSFSEQIICFQDPIGIFVIEA